MKQEVTPPTGPRKGGAIDSVKVQAAARAAEAEDKCVERTKSAAHWLNTLDISQALQGVSYQVLLRHARSCASRSLREGKDIEACMFEIWLATDMFRAHLCCWLVSCGAGERECVSESAQGSWKPR